MLSLSLFTQPGGLKKNWAEIFSPFIPDGFQLEISAFPAAPISLLPDTQPDCIIIDGKGMRRFEENPWILLISKQYPQVPIIYYEEKHDWKKQFECLRHRSKSGEGQTGMPDEIGAKCHAFLERLTSIHSVKPQENLRLPNYSHISFVACAAHLAESFCMDGMLEICAFLTKEYPGSFLYFNKERHILLFVLYEKTSDFTRLELNRQTLIGQAAAAGDFLPSFKFGVLHHGISGLISSFLEAEQVHYVNRLRTPCVAFEEISSVPGQRLKLQKLMEIERSIRTDIQFREGQNALAYIRQWFCEYRHLEYEPQEVKYDMIILYASIKYTLFDMYELKLKRVKSGLEVHEMINIKTLDELEEWFESWFLYTLDNFDLNRTNTRFCIKEVLLFISNHLLDDLSLKAIASYFYVNPSYFSALFKKEMGQTYISYLTKRKMDKARELLSANCKVYEAAHLLGYEDIRHFRNTFKKYHGIPPSEVKPDLEGNKLP